MLTAAPLSTIIALARAGALDHAWGQFSAAGYDRNDEDPAALTVKGRLLKDYALRSRGDQRRLYYLQSAECYRRSAALQPGTYPLINAATLSLLSGDRAQAEEIAREVLERIEREPDEPETPYWRAATEAEALLLLGRNHEARAALEAAVAAAPRAWEDHGSTLRQFLAIQDLLGADLPWLDRLRPPRSLHYSGHVAVPEGASPAGFEAQVAALLDEERVGFGYGALAAGTDLIVAEALLARGAELHVVLPSDAASFAERFVVPSGGGWRRRFEAALEAAETVELVRPLHLPPDRRMTGLAGQIALGAARLNAERLMGEAVQLRVGPSARDAEETRPGGGWRTHVLDAPAGPQAAAAEDGLLPPDSRTALLALLAVSIGSGAEAGFEDRLEDVQRVLELASGAEIAPHLNGDSILIGYASPAQAAQVARSVHARLRDRMPLRLAGHYGLVSCARDPFVGSLRPTENGTDIVRAIGRAIPPDTICVSGDFAAVLATAPDMAGEASWIGELQAFDGGSAIGLYALKRAEGS